MLCPTARLPADRSGGYHSCVRVLGIDFGKRRIGLAISDPSGTLARPLATLQARGDHVAQVAEAADRLAREDEGLGAIVVGLPRRLDGSANEQTPLVLAFVETLRARVAVPVTVQDERLTSVEAESRLAVGDRDWRSRKKKLDAAAAAIILQEYLDRTAAPAPNAESQDLE